MLPDGKTKCNRCPKFATKWVGIADPDAERYPKCELHADTFKLECIIHIQSAELGLSDKGVVKLAESIIKKGKTNA